MNIGNVESGEDPGLESQWIDLLVDGSLDEETRQGLFQKWEADPGGWRRCALAFLEAQVLREGCQRFRENFLASNPAIQTTEVQPFRNPTGKVPTRNGSHGNPWVLAGCLVLSFFLGWLSPLAGPVLLGSASRANQEFAPVTPKDPSPKDGEAIDSPLLAQSDTKDDPVNSPAETKAPVLVSSNDSLGSSPSGKSRQLAQVFRHLEKTGYDPNVRSRIVTVRLPDGRRVEVPVEETLWKYRGKQTY